MPLIGWAADTQQLHLPLTTLRTYGDLHMNGSKTPQPQMRKSLMRPFFRRISAVTAVQPLSQSCTPQLSCLPLSHLFTYSLSLLLLSLPHHPITPPPPFGVVVLVQSLHPSSCGCSCACSDSGQRTASRISWKADLWQIIMLRD